MTAPPSLTQVHKLLRAHHGAVEPPPAQTAFELILWEQVGYLVDDPRRAAAFERLRQEVGLTPDDILAADPRTLVSITGSAGKTAAKARAGRMAASATRVLEVWDGDLDQVLALPQDEAVKELTRYPMIGRPGAEKILLLTGARKVLGLDSNGMRVLLRLGYGTEDQRYDKSYASVQAAVADQLPRQKGIVQALHLLLRRHGQTVCRNTRPLCDECPLRDCCPTGRAATG